ncbi:MAG: UDP-galactopyranose mutase [Treponema sp.]|nr:UDP-galactopyranose mutase [Treponema sp.]
MKHCDYLFVGAGLFSATIAHTALWMGKKCIVLEKRSHIGGNIYTENIDGINVHKYGAHIFHTDSRKVWEFVNQFAEFNRYTNCPVANYNGTLYNLPFNMNTFTKIWDDVITPKDAKNRIAEQTAEMAGKTPQNLEEAAISLVGRDIYERLIKGYTEKQWGRPCTELPASIIRRLPVRFIFDNNYFNDRYQGIPMGGYTQIIEKMLDGADILLNTDFFDEKGKWLGMADKIIYTGTIDRFFDYRFGELEYRSLRFETETLPVANYQGNAVINYTDSKTPYTRIIEHKHFESENKVAMESPVSVITREYPATWKRGDEPYYAINDEKNSTLYAKYKALADKQDKVIFGGRLGMYKYFDMDDTIFAAWELGKNLIIGTKYDYKY